MIRLKFTDLLDSFQQFIFKNEQSQLALIAKHRQELERKESEIEQARSLYPHSAKTANKMTSPY